MRTSEWGPITWIFLHVLADKVIDNEFQSCKKAIIEIINNVINIIPCPFCREWAVNYLKSNPLSNCGSKHEIKMYLYRMHNAVNAKLNKPIEPEENLEQYKRYKLTDIYMHYIRCYSKGRISRLDYGFSKLLTINNIKQTLISNTNKFNN